MRGLECKLRARARSRGQGLEVYLPTDTPAIEVTAACGLADGGEGAGHSEGGTSRDSKQIASLTMRYRLPRTIAIVASVRHDSTGRANFAGFPCVETKLIKWHDFSETPMISRPS